MVMTKAKINKIFGVVRVSRLNVNSEVVTLETWLYANWSATDTIISLIVMLYIDSESHTKQMFVFYFFFGMTHTSNSFVL